MKIGFCIECGSPLEKQNDTRYDCPNGHIFWNNAKTCVTVALVREDGKILYAKRAIEPKMGLYNLPGGYLDFNETPRDAAVRELHEELGITINANDLVLLDGYRSDYSENVAIIDLAFLVDIWQSTPRPLDETSELLWESPDFINDPRFSEPTYRGLENLIREYAARHGRPE